MIRRTGRGFILFTSGLEWLLSLYLSVGTNRKLLRKNFSGLTACQTRDSRPTAGFGMYWGKERTDVGEARTRRNVSQLLNCLKKPSRSSSFRKRVLTNSSGFFAFAAGTRCATSSIALRMPSRFGVAL